MDEKRPSIIAGGGLHNLLNYSRTHWIRSPIGRILFYIFFFVYVWLLRHYNTLFISVSRIFGFCLGFAIIAYSIISYALTSWKLNRVSAAFLNPSILKSPFFVTKWSGDIIFIGTTITLGIYSFDSDGDIYIMYLAQLLLPILLADVSRPCIAVSWLITLVFACIFGIDSSPYIIVDSLFFVVLSYILSPFHQRIAQIVSSDVENPSSNSEHKSEPEIEKKLNTALVHQMLPPKVAIAVRNGEIVEPEFFDDVTVFFSDIEGFTNICAQVDPIEVVNLLNQLYSVMDYCCSLFPLYKVETIGDSYMVVGGLPERNGFHAQHVVDFALLVRQMVGYIKSPLDGSPLRLRMGLHSGSVIAGVVGNLMPRYCLFGDTVNTASRMESHGFASRVHCSQSVVDRLKLYVKPYDIEPRGPIEVKGKGLMHTFWINGSKDTADRVDTALKDVYVLLGISLSATVAKSPLSPTDDPTLKLASPGSPVAGSPAMRRRPSNRSFLRADANTEAGLANSRLPSRETLLTDDCLSDCTPSYPLDGPDSLRILIVCGSSTQRKMMRLMLTRACAAWDIREASSGENALEKLRSMRFMFDVVFVDRNLTENSKELYGHELVKIMRTNYRMSSIIIACTSEPEKYEMLFKDAGATEVWQKPLPSPSLVKSKIDALLLKHGNV